MAIRVFELYGDIELRDAKLKTGLRSANKEFNDFERNAKAKIKGVEGSFAGMGSSIGNFLSRTGANIAGNVITGGLSKIVDQMRDVTTRGMELSDMVQKARLGYGQMLGSDEKGVALIKELVELGNKTQFDTKNTLLYGQQLLAVGVRADEVTKSLLALGDAAASTGNFDRFGQALMAVTQMLSKGKVSAEEMRQQLSEAIPGSQGFMARGLGVSEPELVKLMGEGRINAGPAVRLMLMQMAKERGGFLDKTADSTFESLESRKKDAEAVAMMLSLHGGDMFNVLPDSARAKRLDLYKHQIARREAMVGGNASNAFGKIASAYFGLVDKDEEFLFADSKIKDFFLDLGADVASKPGSGPGGLFGPNDVGAGIGRKIAPNWKGLWPMLRDGEITDLFKNVTGTSIDAVEKGVGPMQQAGTTLAESLYSGIAGFWEIKSPSERAKRVGQWIKEGLEMGLNKGQAKNYASLQWVSEQDPNFIKAIVAGASKRGINPDDMLNLIAIESGFQKAVVNPWGYGGLGQVGRSERAALGLPKGDAEFKKLLQSNSEAWQVENVLFPFLDMKLKANPRVKSGGVSLAELYAMWGSGHATGDPNAIHMAKGGKRASAYANNPLWDVNKDGVVRESEFGQAAMTALGAGRMFSINGQAGVSQSNPMPVQIIDYGNSVAVDLNAGRPLGERAPTGGTHTLGGGYTNQLLGGQLPQQSRSSRTISDPVPVNVDIGITERPLATFSLALNESALNLKKLTDVTKPLAEATKSTTDATDAEMAKLRADAITPEKAGKKKRDKLFDPALTREGFAGDFHGNLQSALMNPFSKKSWGNAGMGLLRDIQGRAAHDLSSSITGMLFGRRGEDGGLSGGLLSSLFGGGAGGGGLLSSLFGGFLGGKNKRITSVAGFEDFFQSKKSGGGIGGLFSKLFGSLFGGFRESGGGMSAGRFYLAGERGPELIAGPGHVYNASQTQRMMGGGGREQRFIFVDSERAAQRSRSARADNFIMEFKRNRHIISRLNY